MASEYGALGGYAKALAKLCRDSGKNKTEIAREAGITRGQLYSALAGDNDLSIKSLGRVLGALGKRLSDLGEVMDTQQGYGLGSAERAYIRQLLARVAASDLTEGEGHEEVPKARIADPE